MADEPNTNPAQGAPRDEPAAGHAPMKHTPESPLPAAVESPAAARPAETGAAAISQEELNALLASAGADSGAAAPAAAVNGGTTAAVTQDDLAAEMAAAIAAEPGMQQRAEPPATPFHAPEIANAGAGPELATLELLDDVELDVKVELGRTDMYIEDILQLGIGSVVSLNKLAGDPVDVFVNERLVARGEVLVLNDNFCVRINEIVSPAAETEAAR